MKKMLVAFLLGTQFSLVQAKSPEQNFNFLPPPLQKAYLEVLQSAKKQKINSRVFNFAYFKFGFCRTCDPAQVQSELNKIKDEMTSLGEPLQTLLSQRSLELHRQEVLFSSQQTQAQDLLSLRLARSAQQAFERSVFMNCLDYAKAIALRAFHYGLPFSELGFYWTMEQRAYEKMCPSREGQPPVLPRPFVHTLLAFKKDHRWYALNPEMNVESPLVELFPLGLQPPLRLTRTHQVQFPPLAAGKPLFAAGVFRFEPFLLGPLGAQLLLNVTASGVPSFDPKYFVCR